MSGLASCRDGNIYDTYQKLSCKPTDIRLLQDRVLVREIPEDNQKNGVFIPGTAQQQGAGKNGSFRIGIVVAVGPGDSHSSKRKPDGSTRVKAFSEPSEMHCKVGDKVIYDRFRDAEVVIDGEVYSAIHEQQAILGILDAA